jgi:hypothetical protein
MISSLEGMSGRLVFGTPFLLRGSLGSGVGVSGVRLDRGSPGKVRLAEFRRTGDRVALVVLNKHFLASGSPAAMRAGTESFVTSMLWSAPLSPDGAVDLTGLALTDVHGAAEALGAGYALDGSLSLPLPESSGVFPGGVRLAAALTFRGTGSLADSVTPVPGVVTITQYLYLVPLPSPLLTPRRYHPASGGYGIGHFDYGLADPDVRVQPRFRLPVVFYVDPAIPSWIRSAVIEGGNWWRAAFSAIGLPDAFQVAELPDGVDPHDPGVNVVWWVHRSGRGWSRGAGLTDPRSGEIVNGRVILGSQRVAQVTALAESLLAPYGQPDEAERLAAVREVVLARMRHLAAHEIGHAIGFMHNYASTLHPRPSVMDYPFLSVSLAADGSFDVSSAYSPGLGPWDFFLVAHAYGPEDSLDLLRQRAAADGLVYVTDGDGHDLDACHPDGVPWVIPGSSPLAALDSVLEVRRIALDRFSPAVLPPGRQSGELWERATLLHLLHRHQVTAVARLIGGARYSYGLAGSAGTRPVAGDEQRAALSRLASLLRAEDIALPESVLDTVTPAAIRYTRDSQYLGSAAGPVFDPLTAAETAAALIASAVLEPARLNRAAWQHARDESVPDGGEITDAVLRATWLREDPVPASVPGGEAVQRAVNWVVLRYVLHALDGDGLHPQVRAGIRQSLRDLAGKLGFNRDQSAAADLITGYLSNPASVKLDHLPVIPPGAPN